VHVVFNAGCADEHLDPLEKAYDLGVGKVDVEAEFCSTDRSELRQRVKYIFVLDKSSSNQLPPELSDPDGNRRYRSLVDFISAATPDPGYTFYGLINFSDTATIRQNFTDDINVFRQEITEDWGRPGTGPEDVGYTNYLAALTRVSEMIRADINETRGLPGEIVIGNLYNIIFVSDGYPEVADLTNPPDYTRRQTRAEILNRIETEVLGLKINPEFRNYIDDIVLHTGYYFNAYDADAEEMLQSMVSAPLGIATSFGAGLQIDYRLFTAPIRNVKYNLSEVFVDNASTLWWDNAQFLRDSDSDGLPDYVEDQQGSSNSRADSDGNGVTDGVEYRTKGYACKDPTCSIAVALRDNYAACIGLMPATWPDGSPNPRPDGVNAAPWGQTYFADSDKDGLNDCEEWILRTERADFDTNDDFLPDGLSFRNRIAISSGTYGMYADPDSDGMNSYEEIQLGLPSFISNNSLLRIFPRDTLLLNQNTMNGTTCYNYTAKDVSTHGTNNLIRVFIVENTATVDDKPVVRMAEKYVGSGGKRVNFTESDFR
jgi:hypothetical protein